MQIKIQNCRIEDRKNVLMPEISWQMNDGEAWLVIGPNGGGKADFLRALAGELRFVANENATSEVPPASSVPLEAGSRSAEVPAPSAPRAPQVPAACDVELVSLERAARIIQEERENDESDYVPGGVDHGRTGSFFIMQSLFPELKKGAPLPPDIAGEAARLKNHPAVKLCGVQDILERGLKYMSTGEIRRTLLARALFSGKKLLILSDPFAGLDVQSRAILLDFFNSVVTKKNPRIILGMERWHEIPDAITHVLEFTDKKVSFCGKRSDYENLLQERNVINQHKKEQALANLSDDFNNAVGKTAEFSGDVINQHENAAAEQDAPLVEMHDVNVGWDGKYVLRHLEWTLYAGEHWLVRGPNGSGKTTFLELITGDNKQVYANDVRIFGIKRGSGESIWDIKKHLGIVSYRMHVEYRMLGGTALRDVIVSGFRDSIGLYGAASDLESAAADKWLALGGFAGRENESFGSLSYGEQRAVLILRSAVKSPRILILDEPCHGLDEAFREKILHLISLICESGTTTVLHVTHDPSEVLPCEKHILEMHHGCEPMFTIIKNT